MNAKDMISVMEYMKAFSKPPKAPKKKEKELDIYSLLAAKERELEGFKKFVETFEKTHKKDEKKDDKKKDTGVSSFVIAMWLIGTFPITAPLYLVFVLQPAMKSLGIH